MARTLQHLVHIEAMRTIIEPNERICTLIITFCDQQRWVLLMHRLLDRMQVQYTLAVARLH
jgi:hypothetical protein